MTELTEMTGFHCIEPLFFIHLPPNMVGNKCLFHGATSVILISEKLN